MLWSSVSNFGDVDLWCAVLVVQVNSFSGLNVLWKV